MSATPKHDLQAPEEITYNLTCTRCGYNLRGLTPDKVCPECATPITRSLDRNLLRYADPNWLNKLRLGTALMLFVPVAFALAAPWTASVMNIRVGVLALCSIGVGLALWAIFRVTTPEPSIALDDAPATLRKFLRACAILFSCGFLVQSLGQSTSPDAVLQIVWSFSALIVMAAYLGQLVYFRRLALRIPDQRLARSTTLVMWGSAVTAGPMIALLSVATVALYAQEGPRRSMEYLPLLLYVALYFALFPALAVPIFLVWYMFLLGRYYKAFQTVTGEARATHAHRSKSGLAPEDD